MHIEFLVEELSAEETLKQLIPKIVGNDVTFKIHPFQGKSNLLKSLPARLRAYKNIIRYQYPNWRIVVLVDEDRQNCLELKSRLENMAKEEGLLTRSECAADEKFQVLNRIAIEELEAWFFGDVQAIRKVYPKISEHLASQSKYRNSDAINGGTWESLERVLKNAGYYSSGMPKTEVARNIAPFMNPEINTSKSFQIFKDGLRNLVNQF